MDLAVHPVFGLSLSVGTAKISTSCFDLEEWEWRMETGCVVPSEILSGVLFGLVGEVFDLE